MARTDASKRLPRPASTPETIEGFLVFRWLQQYASDPEFRDELDTFYTDNEAIIRERVRQHEWWEAALDVAIEYVVEEVKTLAVVLEDIPIAVTRSMPSMEQFLNVEARYAVD